MSFSPEIFRSKLDALQDTQDSIVSISQWVLFHHRNASHLCQLWADYTLDNNAAFSSKKKLSLLYLCNDVVQQARHKRKPEFAAGFAALLPKVFHSIYSTVGPDIQPKMERLISVWSQRNIFGRDQITAMNKAIASSKAGESLGSGAAVAASVPSASVDPALTPLNTLFQTISKASESASANVSSIKNQVGLYLPEDPSSSENLPSPKVYISKLNMLEKLCTITSTTLSDAQKAQEQALSLLAQLTASLTDAIAAGKENSAYIEAQLPRLHTVREELKEMVGEESLPTAENEEPSTAFDTEEPSPAFEEASPSFDSTSPGQMSVASNSDPSDSVPKYASSSDDSDDEPAVAQPAQKRSLPEDESRPRKKSVAFSEDIQIKEFERDERESYSGNSTGSESSDMPEDSFTMHHKDSLQLKHDHDVGDDEYNPSLEEANDAKAGLMDLLSKLN